jgi:hypothetical protein
MCTPSSYQIHQVRGTDQVYQAVLSVAVVEAENVQELQRRLPNRETV